MGAGELREQQPRPSSSHLPGLAQWGSRRSCEDGQGQGGSGIGVEGVLATAGQLQSFLLGEGCSQKGQLLSISGLASM